MDESRALKIALEALLELKSHPTSSEYDAVYMKYIVQGALQEIQREHYLGSPSPIVHELLTGVGV